MPIDSNAPLVDGLDSLSNEHVSNMPEPSEHAIQSEQDDADKYSGMVDKSGITFDPQKHATDSDGNPVKTAAGNWRKKPGRKAGDSPTSTLNTNPGSSSSKQSSGQYADYDDGPRQSAEATIDSLGVLAQTFGGEAYAYRQLLDDKKQVVFDERLNGVRAFERLYREKGVADIPPGVAVSMWAAMFLMSRISQDQKAKSKMKLAWYWLVSKVTRKKRPEKSEEKKDKKDE